VPFTDNAHLSTSQYIGLISLLLGIALLIGLLRRYRRDPDSLRMWETENLAPAGGPRDVRGAERVTNPSKRRKRR